MAEEQFGIYNQKAQNNESKPNQLNDGDRKAFNEEINKELNRLIQDALTDTTDDILPPSHIASDGIKTDELPSSHKSIDPLKMSHSFDDQAKISRERQNRLGILNSDPTGKNIKASGEDT